MAVPSQEPLTIRLPSGMRERIRRQAAANHRSMNSEVVHYIDRALECGPEANGPASVAALPGRGLNNPDQEKADERGNG